MIKVINTNEYQAQLDQLKQDPKVNIDPYIFYWCAYHRNALLTAHPRSFLRRRLEQIHANKPDVEKLPRVLAFGPVKHPNNLPYRFEQWLPYYNDLRVLHDNGIIIASQELLDAKYFLAGLVNDYARDLNELRKKEYPEAAEYKLIGDGLVFPDNYKAED